MPFGLCIAPGTFQRCMMAVFHDMIKKTMEIFMDDFSVFGNSFQSCLSHLEKMLKRNYLLEVRKELKICEAKTDKSSVDEPLVVELKALPPHLKYAFLEADDKLSVSIAKDFSVEEKTALITVLKSHKLAIAWKLSNIKDLGASINLMPYSMWKRLSLPNLTPTCMTLELADRLISRPVGVAEDVYVTVGLFHFLADFVVVHFDADLRVPLILRRSFLKTRRELIDVFRGELTLRVGKEAITFKQDQTLRYSANYSDMTAKRIDVINMACEEYSQEVLVDEPPVIELKALPPYLEYAFLEGDDKLPVIIAKDLSVEEKTALVMVLKSHKRAITWNLSDIKGINLEFYTHKILMEEDFTPAVQHQRRV
nr:reverse transcriptase domain-containing protein [Tanacetum cinerariifolium]